MSRPRKGTPEQVAQIWQLHEVEGLGTRKIAEKLGLRRGLVWLVLHRKRPAVAQLAQLSVFTQLPGEPRASKLLPAPPQPDQWYKRLYPYYGQKPVIVPPGARLVRGRCPMCESDTDIIEGVGLCAGCIEKELHTFRSRPIFWGRCVSCAEPRAIHQMTGSGPVCGRHRISAFMYSAAEIAERTPPRRNSLGLWWDPDGGGGAGCWKA